MKASTRWVLILVVGLFATAASAAFHTYQIEEIFSNASGTVQYIVMHESMGAPAEYFWMGHTISSGTMSYTFPNDLPVQSPPMCSPYYGCADDMMMMPTPMVVSSTANTRVLIATQGFAALGIVTPDYTVPNGFIPIGGGTIRYAEGADQWTFGALPTDGVTALRRDGTMVPNVATNLAGQTASVAAAGPAVDLNQYGLTGSWYQATTSGQGIEVEMSQDQVAPGTAFGFVSWFTYDTVAGGAERQRWYTAQGPVVSGQPSASLPIYQNVGGNFNAPPATPAQAVGTATLSFDTCLSGQLAYSFNDGRNGVIQITRLTQNVTCSTTAARPTNADFAMSGNWFDATTPGQGLTVEVNPNSGALFAAWYTYAPNGAGAGAAGQRWYTAQQSAPVVPGMRSIPIQIYENTGGMFNNPTPTVQKVVGSGTMAFQSCSAATLNYNFTGGSSSGMSGTITLSRVLAVPKGCVQ